MCNWRRCGKVVMKKVFRADHCGSFIRPDRLRKARAAHMHGRVSEQELKEIEDEEILAVLGLQRDAGLEIYSDGEFRRGFWLSAISDRFFEGFTDMGIDYARYPRLREIDIADKEELIPQHPVVSGRLRAKKRITSEEISFLKAYAPGTFKMTVPSPVTLTRFQYRAGVSDRAYPTWFDFFDDFTRLMAEEVKAIVDDGVSYVQLDAPGYSRFIVPERRRQLIEQGLDPEQELQAALAAENRCLRAAKREGVTVAVHICLGTYILGAQGPLGGAGGDYDARTVARIIDTLDADTFLIEYSERSGTLATLREVPKRKTISLGIINVRDPIIESPDDVIRKIEIASKYVPIENLSICPNCGFSGAAADTWITEDVQRRKLEVLVDVARRVWA